MKYVMFEAPSGALFPILFPDHVTHSEVTVAGMQPVSAGFVDPRSGECFGKSDSLGLKSKPDDQVWVAATLTNHNALMAIHNAGEMFKKGKVEAPR